MFTFASDIRVVRAGMMRVWAGQFACRWLLALRWSLAGLVCLAGRMPGLRGLPVTVFSAAGWLRTGGAAARLWRGGGEAGERLAAPLAGFWREAGCGAAGVLVLAGVECGEDALVADGEQAGGEQRDRGQSHEPAPAAADVVAGRVLDGGEGPLGGGAPGVGPAVRLGGVVVFLRGLGVHLRRHGDGLLGAARRGVLGRGEDLGPLVVQGQ